MVGAVGEIAGPVGARTRWLLDWLLAVYSPRKHAARHNGSRRLEKLPLVHDRSAPNTAACRCLLRIKRTLDKNREPERGGQEQSAVSGPFPADSFEGYRRRLPSLVADPDNRRAARTRNLP